MYDAENVVATNTHVEIISSPAFKIYVNTYVKTMDICNFSNLIFCDMEICSFFQLINFSNKAKL